MWRMNGDTAAQTPTGTDLTARGGVGGPVLADQPSPALPGPRDPGGDPAGDAADGGPDGPGGPDVPGGPAPDGSIP
ncbi:hypothetical protein ADK60_16675, partial [Streptomyces sp. XY431]